MAAIYGPCLAARRAWQASQPASKKMDPVAVSFQPGINQLTGLLRCCCSTSNKWSEAAKPNHHHHLLHNAVTTPSLPPPLISMPVQSKPHELTLATSCCLHPSLLNCLPATSAGARLPAAPSTLRLSTPRYLIHLLVFLRNQASKLATGLEE